MSKFLDELCIDVNDYFNVDILKKTRKRPVVMARVCFIVLGVKMEHYEVVGNYLGLDRTSISVWLKRYPYKLEDEHYHFIENYNINDLNVALLKNRSLKSSIRRFLKFKDNDQLEKIKQFIIDLDKKSLDI